jgi:hypothetical protein
MGAMTDEKVVAEVWEKWLEGQLELREQRLGLKHPGRL